MDIEESKKLFRVWKTLLQMLYDRGYGVPVTMQVSNLQEFRERFCSLPSREPLEMTVSHTESEDSRLSIKFPDEPNIKVPYVADVAEKMHREGVQRAIIIGKGNVTSTAKQAIQQISSHFNIEFFQDKELVINITEHELVPKHIIMSEDEKNALLERYKVKESQLPKIQVSDPVARYLGLTRGQVVKIIRVSETAGKYITYRLAI